MALIGLLVLLMVGVIGSGSVAETEVNTHVSVQEAASSTLYQAVDTGNNDETEQNKSVWRRSVYFSPNQAVDAILDRLPKITVEGNDSKIQLEDIRRNFTTKVLLLNVNGEFIATEGKISNFSYERIGDAVLKKDGKHSILSADINLGKIEMSYENYNVSSEGVYQKGKIAAGTTDNTLSFAVEVTRKGFLMYKKCTAILTKLIFKIDGFNMEITNLRIFKNVEEDISQWVKLEMDRYILETVLSSFKKAVHEANLCDNLH